MKRSYSDYIDIIDKVENIEDVVITDNRFKKVCYFVLELIKFMIQYIKNININIDGKEKIKKNKTEPAVSSTDEDKEEIVKETSVIEFACPMCKKILQTKNELSIEKKGNCKCSCIPVGFKISKTDKK